MHKRIHYYAFRIFYILKNWFTRRFTRGGVFVLIGLVAAAIMGIDTKQTVTYQAFTLLSCLLLVSMVTSLFFRGSFSAVRTLPRFGTAGDTVQYRITIQNKGKKIQKGLKLLEKTENPCPTMHEFLETREPGEQNRNPVDRYFGYYRWLWLISTRQNVYSKLVDIPDIQPGDTVEVIIDVQPSRRGYIRFNGITIVRTCPFGLFNAFKTIKLSQSLLILPKRYDLPPVNISGTRKYQSGGIALASSVGDSEEFISMRDYRPGDPLRRIHWKSWAKVGKPVVKEYQDEFFVRHALILDTFHKSAYSPAFEGAVSIAASYACSIQTQESLLDLMFVGTEAYCFTAGRGLAHTDQILAILASVMPCTGGEFEQLAPLVLSRAQLLSGCICVFIAWDEERKRLTNYLKGFGIPVFVYVITDEDHDNDTLDGGIENAEADNFIRLRSDRIQEGLMTI
jgi:hypothetical protein